MLNKKVATKKQAKRRQRKATQKNGNGTQPSMAPAAFSTGYEFKRPQQGDQGAAYVVKHSELLATIAGSDAYAFVNFKINPGLIATFPWLAAIGVKYEQYTVELMRFRFVTRVGTATAGSVILSPDYDAGDDPPATEQEATATANAVENVPWKNFDTQLVKSSMHPNGNRKFTRGGPVVGDIRNFDVGQITIATVGMTSAATVGKLWVDYIIKFFVPQNTPPPPPPLPGLAVYEYDTSFPVAPGVSLARFTSLAPIFDTLGLGNTDSKGQLTLTQGNYVVRAIENVMDEKAGATGTESGSVTQMLLEGLPSGITYSSQALQGGDFPGVQCLLEQAFRVAAGTTQRIAINSLVSGLTPFIAAGTKLLVARY